MDCCCCKWFSGYQSVLTDDTIVNPTPLVQKSYGSTEANVIMRNDTTVNYQFVSPAPTQTLEPTSELSSRSPWADNSSPPLPEVATASPDTQTASVDAQPAPVVVTPLKHYHVTIAVSTPDLDTCSETSSQASARKDYFYLNTDVPRSGSPADARKTGFRCIQCRKRHARDQYSLNQQKKLPSNTARCKACVQLKQEWH